ncbi:MAG: hypothetical protein A2Y73_01465 [Chloroflexi bacterium RBG_13_56_8]|nr:MAG: hypothetical protein A2Y73_01465 [Chloroflexi bacterium RBG_13_56_8]
MRLVLNPDHMSVRETQRAYTYMNLFGLSVDALLLNRLLPERVQDPFFDDWKESQASYRQQVRELFAPLPVFDVPLMPQEVVGLNALEALSRHLYQDSDPVPPLANEQPLQFAVEDGYYMLSLRVAGVTGGAVELEKQGDELRVKLGNFRRSLVLPSYLAGLQPAWARVEGPYLRIAFRETNDGNSRSSSDTLASGGG